uniref:Uncharacterized protein n=1 Tax=Oryza brachyantha TaxID=4533 RepID=J3LVD1_ORYBR
MAIKDRFSGNPEGLTRTNHKPEWATITRVGESRQELQKTGARLARIATALGMAFEFHAMVDRLEDFRLWMLHVKRGKCVTVNCVLTMHRLLRDDSDVALADFLGLAHSTGTAILLLGEHEGGSLNSGRWEAHFVHALWYYVATFDAVDAAGLLDVSPARAKVEEMFALEIRNAVAFEGTERFELHESSAGWWRRVQEHRHRRPGGDAGPHDREDVRRPRQVQRAGAGRWRGAHAPVAGPAALHRGDVDIGQRRRQRRRQHRVGVHH